MSPYDEVFGPIDYSPWLDGDDDVIALPVVFNPGHRAVHIPIDRVCENDKCHNPFMTKRDAQKYCSGACRARMHTRRQYLKLRSKRA